MDRPPEQRTRELSLLAFAVGLLVLATPLRMLWARDDGDWLLPFVLWGLLLVPAALAARAAGVRR